MHTSFPPLILRNVLEYDLLFSFAVGSWVLYLRFTFRCPELRARHDEAVMRAYISREKEVEQLQAEAQAEWEARKDEPVADLALLVQADLHGHRSEQRLGKESLQMTQASLLEATGGLLLSDDARQVLVVGVSLLRT